MSEENTPQETPQAEVTETQPAMNLDSTIQVDGEEVSVKELLNARDEAAKLKEYNEKAQILIKPGGASDTERESAVRYLMSQEGYSAEDINEYIDWTKNAAVEAESMQYEEPQQQPQQPQEEVSQEEMAAYQQYQEQLYMQEQERQRMENIEKRQDRMGADMMKKQLNESLESAFSSDENIKKLMDLSENDNRSQILKTEVETQMLEGLRQRRAAGESFNANWFAEEAGKATKLVYDKFRSVIGDPDKIQRSPETATEDSLFNKPPVDPPKYEKGDDMGSINTKTRDWTLDTLLRGAREGAAGGESKA